MADRLYRGMRSPVDVYATLIVSPGLTAMQLVELTGMNRLKVQRALKVLVDGGIVQRIKGDREGHYGRQPYIYYPLTRAAIRGVQRSRRKERGIDG